MAKLVVEVHDACDLMPKDGQGSSSPFVEVDFDEQRQRTQTKPKELNPVWNEKFSFNVKSPRDLPSKTIEVVVYSDGNGGHHKNFLGRVRISGNSVPLLSDSAAIDLQRYPLERRGLFSHIKGDIALKIYAVHDGNRHPPPSTNAGNFETQASPVFQEINTNKLHAEDVMDDHEKKSKKKNKDKEVRTFHSIGTATGGPAAAAPPPVSSGFGFETHFMREKAPTAESRTDFARAGPPTAMHMHMPKQNPEFLLVETRPPVAARMRYRGDKMACTYDLVEQMHYLYVSVVKARDLPSMDVSGSLDPYVEVFAFSKDRLQSNLVEVTVKDKDFVTKDDFVGIVFFHLSDVPLRVPPDSPLAPQWYRLEGMKSIKTKGEIMLAVWMGTQADESFPEAWHSDAHDISHTNLANTRSKVYFSPKLYYLRVQVIEAQDLIPSDKGRMLDVHVKVKLGSQGRVTRPSQIRTTNPIWNDELMFVVSEPFEDIITVFVEDRIGPGKDEILGWDGEKKKEKFSSKILLRLCLDAGYHVLDEATHFSSDMQPSSKHLRKPSIGILELGILSARNLLPMKGKEGRTTDSYCAAKYGNKWVRTRTIIDTLNPRWNEHKDDSRDQRIGKVRIRLSTLETERIYTHYYPLLVLTPSGLRKHGELHLALRFTCTAWVNMVTQYGKPLLPKMHYLQPISVRHIDLLRHQAMQIVAARLTRAEPPLRREVVEYMLDVDYHMWSLRRSKANLNRIMSLLSGITAVCKWYNEICSWRNPITTCLVHLLFFILVCYPELILPTIFLYLFVIGLWNYRFRPRHPPHMDTRLSQADNAHPDELDEEFDSFPTSRPSDLVRMRYDRMRVVGGKVQTVIGDLASQGERAQALLSWRDPRATAIFILFSLICAVFIYITPFQVVSVLVGLYLLRHPRFRSRLPSVPVNFFKRLPSLSDVLL
uniref:C2 domain-containing protein n=1 Tax=Salix viminalis TaxID=40686 RepID=A0A6N2LSS0_SALVM